LELEIIELSSWGTVASILSVVGLVAGMFVVAVSFVLLLVDGKPKLATVICVTGLALGYGSALANSSIYGENTAQQEASFSQQLEEEYNAKSSRSLADMRKDFTAYNEAATVFTRDGKDTTVFVKKIGNDDKKITMVFTVVDEKSLYPKTEK
jgi:hypothetical protein